MNFYERFLSLCDAKNVSPSRALINAGLSKSLANKWRHNPTVAPSSVTLSKLAVYFGVSLADLVPGLKLVVNFDSSDTETDLGVKKEPILSDELLSERELAAFHEYLKLSESAKAQAQNFVHNLLISESHK